MRTYLFMTMYCVLFFKLLSVWDWLLVPFAISACARHCMTVTRKPYKYNESCAYANGFPVLTGRLGIILTSPTSGNTRSTQYPIEWALVVLPWGLNQLRHEVNHSPPSTSKVKNESSCTFTPPIRLHCKGRNNFAFTFIQKLYLVQQVCRSRHNSACAREFSVRMCSSTAC
jgi:hypothetical protein